MPGRRDRRFGVPTIPDAKTLGCPTEGCRRAGLLFKATRRTERRRAPVSAPPMFGTFESGKSNHGLKSWNIGDNNQAAAEPD
jgi:hypothetical protein